MRSPGPSSKRSPCCKRKLEERKPRVWSDVVVLSVVVEGFFTCLWTVKNPSTNKEPYPWLFRTSFNLRHGS